MYLKRAQLYLLRNIENINRGYNCFRPDCFSATSTLHPLPPFRGFLRNFKAIRETDRVFRKSRANVSPVLETYYPYPSRDT